MHTARRDMLKEPAQKLVGAEGHCLAAMIPSIAIGERYRCVIAMQDCLIGDCRAMHVAPKVLEYLLGALNCWLGERYPALTPRDLGEAHRGQRPSSECQESPTEVLRESPDGYKEVLRPRRWTQPSLSVRGKCSAGDEQVHVRVPASSVTVPWVRKSQSTTLFIRTIAVSSR